MKRVYLFNRSATSNIGDQLIGYVLSTVISNFGYEVKTNSVYSRDGGWLGSLRAHLRSYLADVRQLMNCDFLVIGGGNLIMDVTFGPRWAFHHFWLSLLSRLLGKDYYYVSVGVAPLRHTLSKFLYRFALRNATKVSVRDTFSQKYIQNLIGYKEVELIPDPALGISAICPKVTVLAREKVGLCPVQLYPSICASIETYNGYVDLHVRLIKAFLLKNKEVFLFLNESQLDTDVLNDILEKLPSRPHNLNVVGGFQDVEEYLEFISNLDLVVSSRMHAVICATSYQIPAIGLGWQPKMKYFFADQGLQGHVDILGSLQSEGSDGTYRAVMKQVEDMCGEATSPRGINQVESGIVDFLGL